MSVEAQPVPDLHSVVITAICKVAGWDVTAPMKSGVWLPHDMINVADEVIEALDIPGIRREAQRELLMNMKERSESPVNTLVNRVLRNAIHCELAALDAATPTGGERA